MSIYTKYVYFTQILVDMRPRRLRIAKTQIVFTKITKSPNAAPSDQSHDEVNFFLSVLGVPKVLYTIIIEKNDTPPNS